MGVILLDKNCIIVLLGREEGKAFLYVVKVHEHMLNWEL